MIGSLVILIFCKLSDAMIWNTRSYFNMISTKVLVSSTLLSLIRL